MLNVTAIEAFKVRSFALGFVLVFVLGGHPFVASDADIEPFSAHKRPIIAVTVPGWIMIHIYFAYGRYIFSQSWELNLNWGPF